MSLYKFVDRDKTNSNSQVRFFLDNNVLMRAWKDKASSLDVPWDNVQIVVPSVLRRSLLKLSNDILAASHLAVARTKQRLEAHFYCPSLTQDVKDYFRTCDICQCVGKGDQPTPAPLFPLPVMEKAFQQVAIDIVGPLSVCWATGYCFILTMIDHCTHFPFAVPLPRHEAAFVARALVDIFSHFGFATEIMSDNGSEFRSTLMKTFVDEFSITQIQTRPYHPATNGSIERFHAKMKNLMRSLSEEFADANSSMLMLGMRPYRGFYSRTGNFR